MTTRPPEPRTRLVVVGKSGTGKSSAVKDALRDWLKVGVRVVAVDVCDEYSRHGRETGLVRTGPLRDRVTAAQLAGAPGLLADRRLSLSVVPDGQSPREWARAFVLVARLARHFGRCVLVVDEVATLCDSSLHPECHRARAELTTLSANGRHAGLALVMVSQRAAGVPAGARAQATEVWAFRQDDPDDLAALAHRIGADAAARVSRLALGECEVWRDSDAAVPTNPPALRAVNNDKD